VPKGCLQKKGGPASDSQCAKKRKTVLRANEAKAENKNRKKKFHQYWKLIRPEREKGELQSTKGEGKGPSPSDWDHQELEGKEEPVFKGLDRLVVEGESRPSTPQTVNTGSLLERHIGLWTYCNQKREPDIAARWKENGSVKLHRRRHIKVTKELKKLITMPEGKNGPEEGKEVFKIGIPPRERAPSFPSRGRGRAKHQKNREVDQQAIKARVGDRTGNFCRVKQNFRAFIRGEKEPLEPPCHLAQKKINLVPKGCRWGQPSAQPAENSLYHPSVTCEKRWRWEKD